MKLIKLTKGFFAKVDDDDFEKCNKISWYYNKSFNGYTAYAETKSFKLKISMHRFIMNPKKNEFVDHINGNGLDNRKNNLRICTRSQNTVNSKIRTDNTTGYKGVSYYKSRNKYEAYINVKGKRTKLGYFTCPKEAAIAYDQMAKLLHGEFARLNFPQKTTKRANE